MGLAPTEIRTIPAGSGATAVGRAAARRDRGQLRRRLARPRRALRPHRAPRGGNTAPPRARAAAPQTLVSRRRRREQREQRAAAPSSPYPRRTQSPTHHLCGDSGARAAVEGRPPTARAAPHSPGHRRRGRRRRRNSGRSRRRLESWQTRLRLVRRSGQRARESSAGTAMPGSSGSPPRRAWPCERRAVALLAETLRIPPGDVRPLPATARVTAAVEVTGTHHPRPSGDFR